MRLTLFHNNRTLYSEGPGCHPWNHWPTAASPSRLQPMGLRMGAEVRRAAGLRSVPTGQASILTQPVVSMHVATHPKERGEDPPKARGPRAPLAPGWQAPGGHRSCTWQQR